MMYRTGFVSIVALLILPGCAGARSTTGCAPPRLEVQQVDIHHWEIVVRVFDVCPADQHQVLCSVYRVLEGGQSERLMKLADMPLRKPSDGEEGKFIGVYSNGKEFPHGTKVVVLYHRADGDEPVRASTTMYSH